MMLERACYMLIESEEFTILDVAKLMGVSYARAAECAAAGLRADIRAGKRKIPTASPAAILEAVHKIENMRKSGAKALRQRRHQAVKARRRYYRGKIEREQWMQKEGL